MSKRIISLICAMLIIILAGTMLAACGSGSAPTTASSEGQTLLQTRCNVCHGLDRVTSRQGTADQWKLVVDRMINNGAQLSPQEEQILVTYLAKTYHP